MEKHSKFSSESPNIESSISQDSGQLISDAFLVRITCEIVLFIRIPPCFAPFENFQKILRFFHFLDFRFSKNLRFFKFSISEKYF